MFPPNQFYKKTPNQHTIRGAQGEIRRLLDALHRNLRPGIDRHTAQPHQLLGTHQFQFASSILSQ